MRSPVRTNATDAVWSAVVAVGARAFSRCARVASFCDAMAAYAARSIFIRLQAKYREHALGRQRLDPATEATQLVGRRVKLLDSAPTARRHRYRPPVAFRETSAAGGRALAWLA
jgi:hypothetical protein